MPESRRTPSLNLAQLAILGAPGPLLGMALMMRRMHMIACTKKITFCLGNTIKYVARAGRKDPSKLVEDLKKARFYLNRAIALAEKGGAS